MASVPLSRAEDVLARELLLTSPLTVASLRSRAAQTLGEDRVAQAWQFVEQAKLTRRHDELASLAALVAVTDLQGSDWWERPVVSAYPRDWHPFYAELEAAGLDDETAVTPAEVLAGRFGYVPVGVGSTSPLARLASAAADDAAGLAADFVDMSWPDAHHIEFPPGVGPGEELVVAFDPGGRIRGTTFLDSDGRQMVRVDRDTVTHSTPATVHWAVGVTWQGQVLRLPGEKPGAASDPWSGPLTQDELVVTGALQRWAGSIGVPDRLVEPSWTVREQVADAWVEAYAMWGRTLSSGLASSVTGSRSRRSPPRCWTARRCASTTAASWGSTAELALRERLFRPRRSTAVPPSSG